MASFKQAKQAISDGYTVSVYHRRGLVAVQGLGTSMSSVLVAGWLEKSTVIKDYSDAQPSSQETDALTREQADELVEFGANKRDPET